MSMYFANMHGKMHVSFSKVLNSVVLSFQQKPALIKGSFY